MGKSRWGSSDNLVRLDDKGHPIYTYGGVVVPVTDTPQTALHDDPGFEDPTLADWVLVWAVNGSAASTTSEAMAEERAAAVTLSAAGSQILLSSVIAVDPGDDIEFWVFAHKGTGAPTLRMDMLTRASGFPDYFDEPATVTATGITYPLTTTYAKYPQTFTVPDGHTVARVSFVVEGPAAATAFLDSSGSRLSRSSAVENVHEQAVCDASANPTSTTNVTISGLSVTVGAPSMAAVYRVELDADVSIVTAGTLNIVELLVDGVAESATLITFLSGTGRVAGHKVWSVTGLSAGSHTFTARTRNQAGSTDALVNLTHSVMTVTRMQ